MHIQLNALKRTGKGIVPAVLAALLLSSCGGRSGAAIHAYPQTISFGAVPALLLHGTATVTATATSGLPVSFSSTTPAICSIDGSLVTSITAGNCIIAANQDGDANYAPAPQVTQTISLAIDPNQIITFDAAPSLTLYGYAVVSATVNSGLDASFSSTTPSVCSVNGNTGEVSDLTSGDCIIAADQAGDANHYAAPQVTQTLTVAAWPSGRPVTVSDAPSGIAASMGDTPNTITVSFMGPVSSGGSPITAFNVTSTPSGMSATGAASPITLTCPSSCTGYTFAATATNGIGDSAASAAAHVLTEYSVTATFYEPDTQPNNTIFTGSFTLDSTSGTVSNLQGALTESMTHINDGKPMTTVPLTYQLSAVNDGPTGMLVTTFALNTTNTFSEGGFAPGSQGLYYGYPSATNPANGGVGNAFTMIYVNLSDPTAALTTDQINKLAYADCKAGGMMGSTCMTGYVGFGTMSGFPISQTITRK